MDLIGFCSNLGYFQQVINLGSWKDGYVSVHSELLEVQQKWQNYAIMAFEGLKIQRFLLAHDCRRFANSPKLDQTTGRCVHICPLIDVEVTQLLVRLLV